MYPKEIEWLWQPLKNLKCYHHYIRLVYKLIWTKHNILPCKSSYCSYSRHRTVQLERLAALFPQPITFESRRRNLQRFLKLPQLRVKLLWFPLIKHIIKQEFSRKNKNRHQRRKLKKLRHLGHLLLVIDRTDWKGRNLLVASVICGKRALPVYWILLDKKGSSNLGEQKKFLKPVLKLLKSYPVVVIGDREFQSVQLGKWLDEKGIAFILRQKKGTSLLLSGEDKYQPLKALDIRFFRTYHVKSTSKMPI